VVVVLGGRALCVPASVSAQNMVVQIIQNQCSRAMNADFKAAGKTPPPGMVQDTCNCVAERIEKRDSIEEAKTFCVKQSTAKYGAV